MYETDRVAPLYQSVFSCNSIVTLIIEYLEPCSYTSIHTTASPRLKLLLNTCDNMFSSMNTAVGATAQGVFAQMTNMALGITEEESCYYNPFIIKYNLYTNFLNSLREQIFNIKTYASQNYGNELSLYLQQIINKSEELRSEVFKATNEACASDDIAGTHMSEPLTQYTDNIIGILNSLKGLWTSVGTVISKYVPSILTCTDMYNTVDEAVITNGITHANTRKNFFEFDFLITRLYQNHHTFINDLLIFNATNFTKIIKSEYPAGDSVNAEWTNQQELKFNENLAKITAITNSVISATTNSSYIAQLNHNNTMTAALADFIAASYQVNLFSIQ